MPLYTMQQVTHTMRKQLLHVWPGLTQVCVAHPFAWDVLHIGFKPGQLALRSLCSAFAVIALQVFWCTINLLMLLLTACVWCICSLMQCLFSYALGQV